MNISLAAVDHFIDKLAIWQQQQFSTARNLLLTFPEIKETYRYANPFYDCNGMMLYFSIFKKQHAVIGFVNGYLMENKANMLQAKHGQTQIRHWELHQETPLDEILFVQYVEEAMHINSHLIKHKHATGNKNSK